MAKLKYSDLVKTVETGVEILSIRDFIDKYHPGLTPEAIQYSITKDKIDYTIPYNGRQRFIVMTELTQSYEPMNNVKRSTMNL